ncbi:hypothetical protein [Pseudomonas fluorescens group sp. PF-69]
MATVTFSKDPQAEARALICALSLYLRELPKPDRALPATVELKHDDAGKLQSMTVDLLDE